MNFRSVFLFSIVALSTACFTSPYSQWEARMPDDDITDDQTKIELITKNSSNLSSTELAQVARLYENQEEWNLAITAIKLAIREEPMNSSYHSKKAKYAYELGQVSVAYREALTAYQLGSQSLKQSLDLAKMAVALSEFSIVDEIIDSLLVVYPEDMDVLYMAARKYDKHKNYPLARLNYEKVRAAQPNNSENIIYYSRLLIVQGDLVLANTLLQSLPNSEMGKSVLLLQGDIYVALNQYDSAAIFYRQALGTSADTTIINKTLNAYSISNNIDSLISISREAVVSYPESREYSLIVARNMDLRRRYDEALPYYLNLYERDTLDTLVAAELAYLQRKIAYLQRQKVVQKKLADSLNRALPQLTF